MNERMDDEVKKVICSDPALKYRFITTQRKEFFGLDVTEQYWGREEKDSGKEVRPNKPWRIDAGEGGMNEINVISKRRLIYVVGFGETAEEATNEALKEIYARIHGIGKYKDIQYDFARLTSVCPLCSRGSAQCFIVAILYQIDKNYEDGGKYVRRKFTISAFCRN